MLPRCRTLLGISELPTNDDPLSLSESLSLTLFFTVRRESSVVSFSQKGKRKREKKKSRVQKTFVLKTTHKKSERVFNNNKKTTTTKKNSLQNFSSLILLSRERKKERRMHFQVVNCPSQVCTLRSTTHTQRERDLSFFLSLNSFFVLLSFSSSAFCCFRRVSSLRLSL